MTKYLSSDTRDDDGWESRLQANLFMINIGHSRKSVSLESIKRNTVYNITKASTAIQCPLKFNRIVVSVFGYKFFRGKWRTNYIVHEVS